jgi:hypothetical protein
MDATWVDRAAAPGTEVDDGSAKFGSSSVVAEAQRAELEELARDVDGFLAERPRFLI